MTCYLAIDGLNSVHGTNESVYVLHVTRTMNGDDDYAHNTHIYTTYYTHAYTPSNMNASIEPLLKIIKYIHIQAQTHMHTHM